MTPPLKVCFLWHMHQPSYRDPVSGEVILPWVRLHGVKDYTDMLAAIRGGTSPDAPARTTVNWVPGLLDQCDALAASDYPARERFWRLTIKPAAELSPNEVAFVRDHFFSLTPMMLEPWPRYRELHNKVRARVPLNEQELRDLQVWFNLAWCGEMVRAEPPVATLIAKGKSFSEADKATLLEAQKRAVLSLVERWRALEDEGHVELTASPYYHPILPLLVDSDLARAADPSSPLPSTRFRWRGDADTQVKRAVEAHQRRFGRAPKGMWPSEGSVAASVLPLFRQANVDWVVTDEAILAATLKGTNTPLRHDDKYRPWALDGVKVFFRDHGLSDKIGFVYSSWPAEKAWADMRSSLLAIRQGLANANPQDPQGVVVIALDGENCWEHYHGGIMGFLPGLYRTLAATPGLELVTMSEAAATVAARPLPGLAAGSWIDGTFRTWLGDPVKNRAWELLTAARQAVQKPMDKLLANEPALAELLMRAEASDWWWWFGEGHSSPFDLDFDALFRAHLQAVWLALGKPVPDELQQSVYAQVLGRTGSHQRPATTKHKRPQVQLAPEVDGKKSWYFKWLGAGEAHQSFGSIHRAESVLERVLYGNDDDALYLRVDARDRCDRALDGLKIDLTLDHGTVRLWPVESAGGTKAALDEVLEARVPLALIGAPTLPARLRGHIEVSSDDGAALERFPGSGDLELELVSGLQAAMNRGV